MIYVIGYLAIMNCVTCILYGADKLKAKKGKRRIPEKVLLSWTFLGGSIGAFLGMQAFRHKTKHIKFQICVPLALILHSILGLCAYWYL